MNVDVDEILFVCEQDEVQRFERAETCTLTVKVDGPHLPASGEQLMYSENGYHNERRRYPHTTKCKECPEVGRNDEDQQQGNERPAYHATLGAFDTEFTVESEQLDAEARAFLCSALGLPVYVAMECDGYT